MLILLATGFEIPYNPFDMELLTPFINDVKDKIIMGATLGMMGFVAITGLLALFNIIKGLFR